MSSRRRCLLVLLALGVASPALAKRPPRDPCPPARYRLDGDALGMGERATATIEVGDSVALGAACAFTTPRIRRATRRGVTRIRARWDACEGLDGRVKLAAKIVDGCTRLVGRVRARRLRRRVHAVRSECAPGIFDVQPPAVP